jgi:hypothetical protein
VVAEELLDAEPLEEVIEDRQCGGLLPKNWST